MTALQASTSYAVGFAVSSFPAPSRPSSHRRLILAKVEPTEKSVDIMRKFSEQYARRSDTYFCVDKGVTSVVIKGLAEHRDTLGAPLCPCRHYDDKAAEAQQGFWNCPCVPMRERYSFLHAVYVADANCIGGARNCFHPSLWFWGSDIMHQSQLKKECHCMLFLTPENDFAGNEQAISLEEIKETTANM